MTKRSPNASVSKPPHFPSKIAQRMRSVLCALSARGDACLLLCATHSPAAALCLCSCAAVLCVNSTFSTWRSSTRPSSAAAWNAQIEPVFALCAVLSRRSSQRPEPYSGDARQRWTNTRRPTPLQTIQRAQHLHPQRPPAPRLASSFSSIALKHFKQ